MKTNRIPLGLLLLLYTCFLGGWVWAGSELPTRVATHFNAAGKPTGWMSRSHFETLMLVFGMVFPLIIVSLYFMAGLLPAFLIHIPNRCYWLAPERRRETSNYLLRHSLWLACLVVALVTGIELSLVQANKQIPPHLSTLTLLAVLLPFLAGVLVWSWLLIRRFSSARRAG